MSVGIGVGPEIAVPPIAPGGYSPAAAVLNAVTSLVAGARSGANRRAALERQAVQENYTRALTSQINAKLNTPVHHYSLDVGGQPVDFTNPDEFASQYRLAHPADMTDFDAGDLGHFPIKKGNEFAATIALRRLQLARDAEHRLAGASHERSPIAALRLERDMLGDEEKRSDAASTNAASMTADALRRSALLSDDELKQQAKGDSQTLKSLRGQREAAQLELGVDPDAFGRFQEAGRGVAARRAAEDWTTRYGQRWGAGARERLADRRSRLEGKVLDQAGVPQQQGPSDAFLEFQEALRSLQE